MSYQDELQAKLDAVRTLGEFEHGTKLDTQTLEGKMIEELNQEFELSQYDLNESDILRTLKILDILSTYQEVFSQNHALRVFYALAKSDVLQATNLYTLSKLNVKDFKHLISTMSKHNLISVIGGGKEIEITMDGKSLSERIGFDVFI